MPDRKPSFETLEHLETRLAVFRNGFEGDHSKSLLGGGTLIPIIEALEVLTKEVRALKEKQQAGGPTFT